MLNIFITIEQFLLPCLFRAVFGMDCPGCGFQRSVVLLLQGRWSESFHLYWPTIPVLALFAFTLLHLKFRFRYGSTLLIGLYALNTLFIICHYIYKLSHHH